MNVTLKTLIKDNIANFVCYRDGDLWYRIEVSGSPETSEQFVFDFPVPIGDTGTGVFNADVKAVTLMRWVRKHFEIIKNGEWNWQSRGQI
ncbi:hypothetical protein BH10CYA1_BH10CYA1_04640 [soil metagenome]